MFADELASRSPEMFIGVKKELAARRNALENAIVAAREADKPEEYVPQCHKMLLGCCFHGVPPRVAGEPPKDVEPMRVTLIPRGFVSGQDYTSCVLAGEERKAR